MQVGSGNSMIKSSTQEKQMANLSSFSRAWVDVKKGSNRRTRRRRKIENNRLNRRQGKRYLEDAPLRKLTSLDV